MEPYLNSRGSSDMQPVNLDRYVAKLKTLHNTKKTHSSVTEIVQAIFSRIKELLRTTQFHSLTKEHYLTLLIQENTTTKGKNRGCYNFFQKSIFGNLISKSKLPENSPKLKILSENLRDMLTTESNYIKSFFGQKSAIANKLHKKCHNLAPGESMWIDLSSVKGGHAMKGRIQRVKGEGKAHYIFQMANTGAGLELKSEWHKEEKERGFYQTVVEWGPFEADGVLTEQFFKDILNATVSGIFPKDREGHVIQSSHTQAGPYGESLKEIEAVYRALERWLPEDKLQDIPFDRGSPYWSYAQEGPSCVPQSIWALSRVSVDRNDYNALKVNAQLKNLKYLYKKISKGEDRSQYACRKAYEQAIQLVCQLEHRHQQIPPIFKEIISDLYSRLNKDSCIDPSPVIIINNTPFQYPANTDYVYLRQGTLTPLPGGLKAKVTFQQFETDNAYKIPVKNDANNEILALSYLLYESLLTNDESKIEENLRNFIDYINSKPGPNKIPCYNLPALRNIIILFTGLSADFRATDGTLASRAKPLAMNNIAQILFSIYHARTHIQSNQTFKDDLELFEVLKTQATESLAFCDNVGGKLNLKQHFPDNIWYTNDQNLRPHTLNTNWVGYTDRRDYDLIVSRQDTGSITKETFGEPKTVKARINPESSSSQEQDIDKGGNKEQSLQIIPFDYKEENGMIYTSQPKYYDKTLPAVKISQDRMGNYQSESLPGKIYLISFILAQGGRDENALNNLTRLISEIGDSEVKEEDIPSILETARILANYNKSLGKSLDKHPESALLQKTLVELSHILLLRCQAKQESLVKHLENESPEQVKAQALLHKITEQACLASHDIQYFTNLNPSAYVVRKHPLLDLHGSVRALANK